MAAPVGPLIGDAEDVKTADDTGVLGGLLLVVVAVGRTVHVTASFCTLTGYRCTI